MRVLLLVISLALVGCQGHVPSRAYGAADVAVKAAAAAVELCADNSRCAQEFTISDFEFAQQRVHRADEQLDEVEPLLLSPNPDDEDKLMTAVKAAKRVADEVYDWITEF